MNTFTQLSPPRFSGCSHNGTMFADGSFVPSLEPCLSCKCVDSHLKCSLRVCAEQPIPPPRGCVLVHKRSLCCPHVSCNKYHNENENPERRVIAYHGDWYSDDAESQSEDDEDKRQKVLSKNSLYRRIDDEETDGNDEMCVHNGTIYRTGSAMSTSSLCSYCYCIGGKQKCVRPKCLITSPGCVPVFIDSSCCPIRYDCKEVTSGVTAPLKPKTIYYRIDNKHYNRMRSRAQRNRGCLVASTYYAEGEKLPTNSKKPCDLCFCIRGESKCTPKKCAPYIGNCKPKIPEGQCCPAHYECDHSDETSPESSHRPRQFDLLSYFFSEENSENETNVEPSDRPLFEEQQDYSPPVSSTSEKSFFDALRDGLNYIDSNDDHVEKILDPTALNASTITDRPLQVNTTEPSFFDILLSNVDDDDDEDYDDDDKPHGGIASEKPWIHHEAPINLSDIATVYVSNLSDAELHHNRYTLLDESTTHGTTTPTVINSVQYSESSAPVKTSNYDRSATEKIIAEYITYTSVPSDNFDTSTMSTSPDFETTTLIESTTQEQSSITPPREETVDTFDDGNSTGWSTSISTLDDDTFSETTSAKDEMLTRLPEAFTQYDKNVTDQTTTTTEAGLVSAFLKEFSNLFGDENTSNEKHDSRPEIQNQKGASTLLDVAKITNTTQASNTPSPPKTTKRVTPTIVSSPVYPSTTSPMPVIITVTSSTTRTTSTSPKTTTPSSTPNRSPTSVTIHPKATTKTQQTTTPIPITTTPSTVVSKPSHTSNTYPKINVQVIHSTSAIEHPSTTEDTLAANQPTLIGANPSILDSDLNYDYGDQPTLPPSLPNLKIIPFLPTDAVRKDNVHPKLEYYSPISTSYPVLTENYENPYLTSSNSESQNADFTAFEISEPEAKDSPDFNSYSIRTAGYSNDDIFGIPKTNGESLDYSQYPSITEKPSVEPTIHNKYAAYSVDYDYDPFEKDNEYAPGSYKIVDGHDYSIQSRNPSFEKFVTEYPERHVHSKIEFSTSNPLYGFNGNNKFSPPSKTEGGFLPKEPSPEDDQYYEKLHTTKYTLDLLTESSPKSNATVQLIGITSEDPFKNVIRTEPPPNLDTLIEDKEKLFHTVPELTATNIDHDYPSIHLSDIEKEIISITTDSNYNPSPEYESDSLADNIEYSFHHFDNDTISNVSLSSTNSTTSVSVSSDFQSNTTTHPAPKDFLGSLLGYIFKDNKINSEPTEAPIVQERQTIPPFKKISSTSLSLMDILNFTKPVESSSKKVDIPQRKNNKIYEYPTTTDPQEETSTPPREENLNILRDVLLATLNSPSNIDTVAHRDSHPTIDVPKPIYSSHSIHQFLNPIFAGNSDLTHVTSKYSPFSSDIDLSIPKLNSQIGDNKDDLNNNVFGPESYQVLSDYPSTANHKPFGENPIDYDALKEHHSDDNSPSLYTKPNGYQNSMGMLKLAGCNIYGRMYRVGRIITELSNPCLECKCTEVGVHCTTLSC
ncbi:hypothetical protein HA402_000833 [Bradysia odoriphaga]|nr:hypothetical protein HA402_000833 [Bradysia odoriphaga]